MTDLQELTKAIERGDRKSAVELTRQAIDAEIDAQTMLDAMTAAMTEVGRRFATGDGVYIPEMLVSANAMKKATELLEPILIASGIRPEHTAIIGTVKGDLHDIGKDLVAMMWKGAHIEVIDLGVNVEPERFVEAARENDADIVGVSALLTTTMMGMADVVRTFQEAGLGSIPIIVGGAPIDQDFADRIGASGYAKDAARAVTLTQELLAPNGPAATAIA